MQDKKFNFSRLVLLFFQGAIIGTGATFRASAVVCCAWPLASTNPWSALCSPGSPFAGITSFFCRCFWVAVLVFCCWPGW